MLNHGFVGRALSVRARALAWVLVGVAGLVGGCAAPASFKPAETVLATPRVEVPMRLTATGLPEVAGVVGSQKVRCILDTGAFAPLAAPQLAPRAQLGVYPQPIAMEDAGGNRRYSVVLAVPQCVVGGATFTNFAAVQTDLSALAATGQPAAGAAAPPVEFVLAPSMFQDVLLTIDYPRGRLVMERGELPPPDGRDVLPMQVAAGGRLLVPAQIARQEVWLLLDTGCTPGLAVPEWAVGAFPGAGQAIAAGEVKFYYGRGSFELSRLTEDLRLGRHVVARPLFMARAGKDATLGSEYLRNFAVTIDQKNQRVRFTRASAAPIAVPAPPMLAMHWRTDTGAVVAVKEGGSAARAGVRVGTRIVSVEGIPFREFAAGKLPRWVKRPGYLTFEMVREDNTPMTVEIPIREMMPTAAAVGPAGGEGARGKEPSIF